MHEATLHFFLLRDVRGLTNFCFSKFQKSSEKLPCRGLTRLYKVRSARGQRVRRRPQVSLISDFFLAKIDQAVAWPATLLPKAR